MFNNLLKLCIFQNRLSIRFWVRSYKYFLTWEWKDCCIEICREWLKRIKDKPHVIGHATTGDKSWIHHFDSAIKQESMRWKSPPCPVMMKVYQAKLMNKVMLISFFSVWGTVYQHIVPCQATINTLYYCEVLSTLKRYINKKRPDQKKIVFCTTTMLSCTPLPSSNFRKRKNWSSCTHHVQSQLWPYVILGFWSPKMEIAQ